MKITKDTKLGEIIPEGFKLDERITSIELSYYSEKPVLFLWLQKKKAKTFDEYFELFIKEMPYNLLDECFEKQGHERQQHLVYPLLKYICRKENVNYLKVFDILTHNDLLNLEFIYNEKDHAISKIFPDCFIKSLLD